MPHSRDFNGALSRHALIFNLRAELRIRSRVKVVNTRATEGSNVHRLGSLSCPIVIDVSRLVLRVRSWVRVRHACTFPYASNSGLDGIGPHPSVIVTMACKTKHNALARPQRRAMRFTRNEILIGTGRTVPPGRLTRFWTFTSAKAETAKDRVDQFLPNDQITLRGYTAIASCWLRERAVP